jgi:hypothetical protein
MNPLTGVVDLFHVATVGMVGNVLVPVMIAVTWTVGLLTAGIALQSRFDRVFADLL